MSDCNFIDWYMNCGNRPLIQQIPTIRSNCYDNVEALINYTVSYNEENPGLFYFYNININDSFNGDRIWNFVYGGETTNAIFQTIFNFNANCVVPNGYDTTPLKNLNFDKPNGSPQPFQGYMVINNIMVGISNNTNLISYTWDATNATFTLNIDLTKANLGYIRGANYGSLNNGQPYPVKYGSFFAPPPTNPDPSPEAQAPTLEYLYGWNSPQSGVLNSFFANLWIRDAAQATLR